MKLMSKNVLGNTSHIRIPLTAAIAVIISSVSQAAVFDLEEIVVTAQKREQNLQDVGISVAAFSSKQMSSLGWSSSEEIAAQVPGLTTSKTAGAAVSQFNIRGIGQADFADHHEAPNSVYIDDVYVAAPGAAGFPMFDLERVEVLRGPQGTLFGRNATGGLVHFISKKPTEETEGYVSGKVGEFSLYQVEGALSGRLSENVLGRLSAYWTESDGYVDNKLGSDLREQGTWAARGQLNFEVSDKTDLHIKLQGFSEDVDAGIYKSTPSYTDPNGVNQFIPADLNVYGVPGGDFYGFRDTDSDPLSVQADQIGTIQKDIVGTTIKLTHDFNDMSFVSVTDFSDAETKYREDTDSGPFNQTTYNSTMDVQQFSQEFRLSGETESVNWVAGFYYLNISGDYSARFDLPTLAGFFDPGLFPGDGTGSGVGTGAANQSVWSLDTDSWAVFTQAEWTLTDTVSLTTGLRWTEDSKDYSLTAECFEEAAGACAYVAFGSVGDIIVDGVNLGPAVTDIASKVNLDRDDSDWSGKLQLDYRPDEGSLYYFSVSKGIKGGGFTTPLDGLLAPSQLPYKPEEIFAYEIGTKLTLVEDTVSLNSSIYYYDYSDFQTFEFRGITSVVLNKDAVFKGGELELVLTPGDSWDVLLGAAYLDATVEDIQTPSGLQDQEPINAPKIKYNWLIRKGFAVKNHEISIQYDGSWTDERYFNIVNGPTVLADSYVNHNIRIGISDDEGVWDASVFVKNFTDEEYVSHAFDLTVLGYTIQKYGSPRWVGAQFSYRF